MMPGFAGEALAISVKRPLNAMDAFIGRCEGFSIELSHESLNREIFPSPEDAWPFAGSRLR